MSIVSHPTTSTGGGDRPSYLLSELLAEFSAGFRGPPKSRDEAGPYHAYRDGCGAMDRDVDNRYLQLS